MKINNELLDEYVRNFSPTNYADILIRTQKLVDGLVKLNKLPASQIKWEEKSNLAIWASTNYSTGEITLNLTLIRAIVELNLDSYSPNFISKLKIIAKNYFKGNIRHNTVSDSLIFTINNRPIESLLLIGNKQALTYNLLITTLHEMQHLVQLNSNKVEYQFMVEQDRLMRAGEYNRFKNICEMDATAESLQVVNDYLTNKKYIDKNLIKNIIGLNCYSIKNPEKYVENIVEEFNLNKSPQQILKIKKFCIDRLNIINNLYNLYK